MKCKFCNKPFLDSSRLSNHEFACGLKREESLQRKWAEENLKRENLKRGMHFKTGSDSQVEIISELWEQRDKLRELLQKTKELE